MKPIDPYIAPSHKFQGSQQFFYRFIVGLNDHRFNQCLLHSLICEIEAIIKSGMRLSANGGGIGGGIEGGIGGGSGGSGGSKGTSGSKFLSSCTGILGTGILSSSSTDNTFLTWSAESYALSITKLKILGKFIGLLQHYPQWVLSTDITESGPLQLQYDELAMHSGVLSSFHLMQSSLALPIRRMLEQAWINQNLCLTVPWIVGM